MRASVMLESSSGYEVMDIRDAATQLPNYSLLILHKKTETGSPFLVVAGYFLNEVGKFEQSVLAEIETISESDYPRVKEIIRKESGLDKRTPITFW